MNAKTFRKAITAAVTAALICAALLLSGCGGSGSSAGASLEKTGSMDLSYATQFSVDYYADGTSHVKIGDGLEYLLVPEGTEAPDAGEGVTVIQTPVKKAYVAASSSMDLINAAGGMDSVMMTSTEANDWAIPEIREAVGSDKIRFIGKYSAPDYEALIEDEADIAIESTMIYHKPQVKEAIEELGIPVLVERSSYENDPLARLEWIKLYGLLFGREDEAEAFFDDAVAKVSSVDTASVKETPSVAFFSVNSAGAVVVRKPGDYITKMIETAGGRYALDGITPEEDNALSTVNMQMEAFYDKAVGADILIYNSAIESDLSSVSDLTALSEQFEDFAAVKSGNVWCTNKNVYQKTTGAADMITELNRIFAGAPDDSGMEYFHKLK
jgi:iron complex transport system substrate-binding protein